MAKAGGRALSASVAAACAAALATCRPPEAPARSTGSTRAYEALMASSAPVIDGDLGDGAWRDAPWTESFVDIRGEDWTDPEWATRARLTWDECCLYVAAELEEPHLWATLTERDAIIYRDHDFEVFLDPDGHGVREGVAALAGRGGTPLCAGLYLPSLDPAQLAEAVETARAAAAEGVSLFEMDGLSDEHLAALRSDDAR